MFLLFGIIVLAGLLLFPTTEQDTLPSSPCWYFAYGANMNTEVMKRRGIKYLFWRRYSLKGYRLLFNQTYLGGMLSFANIVPLSGHSCNSCNSCNSCHSCNSDQEAVEGVLYMLDPSQLKRLHSYELGYNLKRLSTQPPIYTFVGLQSSFSKYAALPSSRYLKTLIRGAQEHGLNRSYIQKLREQPTFGSLLQRK
jgi:hypothetical protein